MKRNYSRENNLKGSETEKNLWKAFAGECEARVRYEFFADIARKDGYEQIGAIFDETSHNEREHAEIWYKYLGQLFNTEKNLERSATLEEYEATEMYVEFADIAEKEGFTEISEKFREVAGIEKAHNEVFVELRENILDGEVFYRDEKVMWQCRNCGYLVLSENAPEVCKVCGYPQAYFQLREDNF